MKPEQMSLLKKLWALCIYMVIMLGAVVIVAGVPAMDQPRQS